MEAIKRITKHIPRLVTEEQNNNLNKPIAKEENDQVIQEMPNGKAPGPDGFTVELFKACWEVVKHDVYRVGGDSRWLASILKVLNATMITLIPKENEARTPDRYSPITLCKFYDLHQLYFRENAWQHPPDYHYRDKQLARLVY